MAGLVRLTVLGLGSWTAVNHLPALEGRTDVVLLNALDTNGGRRDAIRKRFSFAKVTGNLSEALDPPPDAVIVGASPDAHYPLTKAALEVGAHVLCEKPFTLRASDAWELVRLAERKQRHLLTAYGWNYFRMAREARLLLGQHSIGNVEHIQIHMATALREVFQQLQPVLGRPPGIMPLTATYTQQDKGAGYTQFQLTHALGLALWLTGLRGESVFAFMSNPGAEVDLHDALAIRFVGGAIGSVSGSVCPRGSNNNKIQMELRVFGSRGQLILDFDREFVWLYTEGPVDIKLPVTAGEGEYECSGPPNALIDLALGRSVENCSPGELGARSTEITEAAYASWRSGKAESI